MLSTSIHRLHDLFHRDEIFSQYSTSKRTRPVHYFFWCALICRDEKSSVLKNLDRALHTGGGRCMLSVGRGSQNCEGVGKPPVNKRKK